MQRLLMAKEYKKICRLRGQGGFSLLEVVITIGILLSLTMAMTSMLRSSFDIRDALSLQGGATHRLGAVAARISDDLEHAFVIPTGDLDRNAIGGGRRSTTVFRIERVGDVDKLTITTLSGRSMVGASRSSDLAYVVYSLRDSPDLPGRRELLRGKFDIIPEESKDDPPMEVMVRNVKSVRFKPWDGEKFSEDRWDSGRAETRNKMPHVVKVEITVFPDNPDKDTIADAPDYKDEDLVFLRTAVTINQSLTMPEIKQPMGSMQIRF